MGENKIEILGGSEIPDREKKEDEDKLSVEKLHSIITQSLADSSEYFLEDVPKSKEEIIELIPIIYKDYKINENIPPDDVIDKLYPLFLEDWERERKDRAGFDRDEDWPNPNEWAADIQIEDSYPDFEEWKKPKIKKIPDDLEEQSVERPMPLSDFLNLLKQEIIAELSKIDEIGLTDEQKRYLGIKKSFMEIKGMEISRGTDFGSMPYTNPKVEINENDFAEDKNGLEKLEELLNSKFKFTHFDNFWKRAEGLEEQLYEKIRNAYGGIEFHPINLPGIRENWLKIKEYNDKKEQEIKERQKNYIGPYEAKRLGDERDKIRYARNKEELIQKILKERSEK